MVEGRGKFRSFLLTALNHFLTDDHDAEMMLIASELAYRQVAMEYLDGHDLARSVGVHVTLDNTRGRSNDYE